MSTPSVRPDPDPFLAAVAAARRPSVSTMQWPFLRLQQRSARSELRALDQAFDAIAARRRDVVRRLEQTDRVLRKRYTTHHGRRRMVDVAPPVPADDDASLLVGADLRDAALAILRRHGPLRLRELHDLIHRYGYEIAGLRPVQRLADAMAYETRTGRCRRVQRGVYDAVAGGPRTAVELGQPSEWHDPDVSEPMVDPGLAYDTVRWGPGNDRWPPEAEARRQYPAPDVDESIRRIRSHLASLAHDELVDSVRAALADPARPYPGPADHSVVADWQRFVNESSPTDRRRLAWEEPAWRKARRERASGARRETWPDDQSE